MKILIKFALLIIAAGISSFGTINCSQPVTLVSSDGVAYSVERSAAMASKTIAAMLQNPGFAESTTNEITFSSIESRYLTPLVHLLPIIKPDTRTAELVASLESQDHDGNTSVINLEFLDIVNFLKIKPLKHALANALIQKIDPWVQGDRNLMKEAIKKLPFHLQGIMLTHWFLNTREQHCIMNTQERYLFSDEELRTMSGFGFTLEQLIHSNKSLDCPKLKGNHAFFTVLFLKNLHLPVKNRAHILILNASWNLLRTVPQLAGFDNLNELDLSENRISTITPETFNQTPVLRKLVLNRNQIKAIPNELFAKTPLLEHIFLNNNCIRSLTTKPFEGLTNLCNLYLFNNPLDKPSKKSLDAFSVLSKDPCRLVFTDPE